VQGRQRQRYGKGVVLLEAVALRTCLPGRDTSRAMSQEYVEIMRATFEAWNAGDMNALRELYDPNVTLRLPEGFPEPGPYVGREAVMRQWEQQREAFDADTSVPISDFIDTADRVAVRFIWAWHGPRP
jgi:ketosteroid isomerase-like protein